MTLAQGAFANSWMTGAFALGGATVAVAGALGTQWLIDRFSRRRERYSALRHGYVEFAKTVFEYATAAVVVGAIDDELRTDQSSTTPAGHTPDLREQLWARRQEAAITLGAAQTRLNGAAASMLVLEHHSGRRTRIQQFHTRLVTVFFRHGFLPRRLGSMDIQSVVSDALQPIDKWMTEVGESLRIEESEHWWTIRKSTTPDRKTPSEFESQLSLK